MERDEEKKGKYEEEIEKKRWKGLLELEEKRGKLDHKREKLLGVANPSDQGTVETDPSPSIDDGQSLKRDNSKETKVSKEVKLMRKVLWIVVTNI